MTNTISAISIDFDDWDLTSEDSVAFEKPKQVLIFDINVLALVLSMYDDKKQPFEVAEFLHTLHPDSKITVDNPVSSAHVHRANQIYDHFANRIILRRLKGQNISKYLLTVEELCENRTAVEKDAIPVLVTLPKFYKQNQELESLSKEYNSAEKIAGYVNIDETVEFVKSVHVENRRKDETWFFWRRTDQTLVKIIAQNNDVSVGAWKFLASLNKIHIKSSRAMVDNLLRCPFNIIDVNNRHLEIELAE